MSGVLSAKFSVSFVEKKLGPQNILDLLTARWFLRESMKKWRKLLHWTSFWMIKEALSKDGEIVWSLEESYPVTLLLVGEEGG